MIYLLFLFPAMLIFAIIVLGAIVGVSILISGVIGFIVYLITKDEKLAKGWWLIAEVILIAIGFGLVT